MYATYAKLAYKLMILVKHFCVLIFSIFRVFVTICHFSDVTINSFNSCVVAYFLNYISRLYRLTLRLLVNTQPHRSWEQCAISRQIERAYKNLGSLDFSNFKITCQHSNLIEAGSNVPSADKLKEHTKT